MHPNHTLSDLIAAHGIRVQVQGDWLTDGVHSPKIRARFTKETEHPSTINLQLEVDTLLSDGRIINESFAGWANTREDAELDAFRNFSSSTLHVLLKALWNAQCCDQTDSEIWHVGDSAWKVTNGLYTVRSKVDPSSIAPPSLVRDLRAAISSTSLSPGENWFRHYFCNVGNGNTIAEALKNNARWTQGETVLKQTLWPGPPGEFWSTRNFLLLQPL